MTAPVVAFPNPDRGRPLRVDAAADLRPRLHRGELIRTPIRFANDSWDLRGAPSMGDKATVIHFTNLPARDRHWAKEYLLIAGSPTFAVELVGNTPGAVQHAAVERGNYKTAKTHLDVVARVLRAAEAVPDDHPDYWHEVLARWDRPIPAEESRSTRAYDRPTPQRIAATVEIMRLIHRRMEAVGLGSPFPSRPWGTRHADAVAGLPPESGAYVNKKRPHEHVFPWVGICLRALEVAGPSVLTRVRWYAERPDSTVTWHLRSQDLYARARPDEPVPQFASDEHPLLPTTNGLYWWADKLVYAAYYVIAALTGLREEEINFLSPDCITADGRAAIKLTGMVSKGRRRERQEEETWTVNAHVATAVEFINELRDALGVPPADNPKLPGRPMLFHASLLSRTRGDVVALRDPLRRRHQPHKFGLLADALHDAGLIPDPSGLEFLPHGVLRITCLEVHASGPLGDAVAASVGKWRSFKPMGGYIGHTTKVTAPPPSATEELAARSLLPIIEVAAATPDELTGRSAETLRREVAALPELAAPTVSEKAMLRAAKKGLREVTVGPLCACVGPSGGLCGDGTHANHALCAVGCRNAIFTPYQRAHLELRRRFSLAALGPLAPFAARVTEHEDSILADESQMTYDELVDVLLDAWQTDDRELADLFYPLLKEAA